MPEILESRQGKVTDKIKTSECVVKAAQNICKWRCLPYELWMTILVEYGAKAEDLVSLEKCCKWLGLTWTTAGNFPNSASRLHAIGVCSFSSTRFARATKIAIFCRVFINS